MNDTDRMLALALAATHVADLAYAAIKGPGYETELRKAVEKMTAAQAAVEGRTYGQRVTFAIAALLALSRWRAPPLPDTAE